MPTGKVNAMGAMVRMETESAFISITGSLRASNLYSIHNEGDREYVVTSYGVPIAKVTYTRYTDEQGNTAYHREVWITDQKYSVTTSKHTGMARRALQVTK